MHGRQSQERAEFVASPGGGPQHWTQTPGQDSQRSGRSGKPMGRSECGGGLSVETQGREETAGSGTGGLRRGGARRGQGCAGKRGHALACGFVRRLWAQPRRAEACLACPRRLRAYLSALERQPREPAGRVGDGLTSCEGGGVRLWDPPLTTPLHPASARVRPSHHPDGPSRRRTRCSRMRRLHFTPWKLKT